MSIEETLLEKWDVQFRVRPSDQGQIVEVAWAIYPGGVYRREVDGSDRSRSYQHADLDELDYDADAWEVVESWMDDEFEEAPDVLLDILQPVD